MSQERRPKTKMSRNELAEQFKDRRELNIALGKPGIDERMSDEYEGVLKDGARLPQQRRQN